MTINQTIYGVPRDRLELCVKALASTGYTFESNELRAMLDAPECKTCGGSGYVVEPFSIRENTVECPTCKPAARPQGEPVAALQKARDVLRAIIKDKAAGVHYASAQAACHQINHALEQPAPVALLLPDPKVVSMIVTRAARQADLTPGANYHTAAELAADAILFEVAALNLK